MDTSASRSSGRHGRLPSIALGTSTATLEELMAERAERTAPPVKRLRSHPAALIWHQRTYWSNAVFRLATISRASLWNHLHRDRCARNQRASRQRRRIALQVQRHARRLERFEQRPPEVQGGFIGRPAWID